MQIGILRARLSAAAPVDSGCDGANEKSPDGVARRGPSCCLLEDALAEAPRPSLAGFRRQASLVTTARHSAALGDQSLRIQETED